MHTPLWEALVNAADLASLDPGALAKIERRPDVLVIGGGVVGLATAVFCRRLGLGDGLVIERGRLASGPSGSAAGALIPEVHALTDPPDFVTLARAGLELNGWTPSGKEHWICETSTVIQPLCQRHGHPEE